MSQIPCQGTLVSNEIIGKEKTAKPLKFSGIPLVGMTGFEPAAFASRTQRSTKLSHIPILY